MLLCRTSARTATPLVGVENFYKQYENTVDLYNEKFAKPAKAIMDELYAANKLTKTPFDEGSNGPTMSSGIIRGDVLGWARR